MSPSSPTSVLLLLSLLPLWFLLLEVGFNLPPKPFREGNVLVEKNVVKPLAKIVWNLRVQSCHPLPPSTVLLNYTYKRQICRACSLRRRGRPKCVASRSTWRNLTIVLANRIGQGGNKGTSTGHVSNNKKGRSRWLRPGNGWEDRYCFNNVFGPQKFLSHWMRRHFSRSSTCPNRAISGRFFV